MASSLDIFKQYLASVQGAGYYSKWASQNPVLAARWYAFRDKVRAGTAKLSDAPDMRTSSGVLDKFGDSLVKAALMPLYPADVVFIPPSPSPSPSPTPPPSPTSQCYTCARIDGQFYQTYKAQGGYTTPDAADAPWSGSIAGDSWDAYEAHAGKKLTAIHYGGPGSNLPGTLGSPTFDTGAMQKCRARGAFANYTLAASAAQMADLESGSDANGTITAVRAIATAINNVGDPILIRFCHEMNATWGSPYPWQTTGGTSSTRYVNAWKALVNLMRPIAPNISFFWCPNIINSTNAHDPTPWFPGTPGAAVQPYVDAVGFDGYAYSGAYVSPGTLYGPTLAKVQALAPSLSVVIGELGVDPAIGSPGKAAWWTEFLGTFLPNNPVIDMFSVFNEAGSPQLPHIEVGDGATTFGGNGQKAYHDGVANSRYLGNIVNATTFPAHTRIPWPS